MPTIDETDAVASLLNDLGELGLLPEVTQRLIAVVDDPESTPADLAAIIEYDPVLAGKLVKVANSPMYGLTHQVGSVRRSIELLGYQATRNVAVACSMATLRRVARGVPGFGAVELWHHLQDVAVAAHGLANAVRPSLVEQAQLTGMLHDLGLLIFMIVDPVRFATLAEAIREGRPSEEVEREVFGVDHRSVGATLCEQWRLPPDIVRAVRSRDGANPATSHPLTLLVTAAHGFTGTFCGTGAAAPAALTALGVDDSTEARLRGTIAQQIGARPLS